MFCVSMVVCFSFLKGGTGGAGVTRLLLDSRLLTLTSPARVGEKIDGGRGGGPGDAALWSMTMMSSCSWSDDATDRALPPLAVDDEEEEEQEEDRHAGVTGVGG
jgi:hypothetical protein